MIQLWFVLLLLQVPPPPSLKVALNPTHIVVIPEIEFGNGFTITVLVLIQPVPSVYVIVVVPDNTLATIPEPERVIVATAVLLLLHVPPPVTSLKDVDWPRQIFELPVIDAGNGLTTTEVVIAQPVPIP